LRLLTQHLARPADPQIKVASNGGKIRNENPARSQLWHAGDVTPRTTAAYDAKAKMLKICTSNDFLLIMLHQRRAARYWA
jgi:hypothetical protein